MLPMTTLPETISGQAGQTIQVGKAHPATYHSTGTPRLRFWICPSDSHPSGGFPVSDFGFLSTVNDIELTVQISRFVLRFSRVFQQIFIPQSAFRNPHSSARHLRKAGSQLHDLASAVHDISRLVQQMDKNKSGHQTQ
jgi:hypothetical protein